MEENSPDVIVIGAGAAGAAVSYGLAKSGISVICLEQGDYTDPSIYPSTEIGWEKYKFSAFNSDPNVRMGKADYPINNANSPISVANFNAVGGSTILFSGHYPRLHPSDLRSYSLDGVASDWPISYEELENYYNRNQENVAVAGLAGDPSYPPIKNLLPPVPMGKMGQVLAEGFNKKGWHWWPAYSAIATRDFHSQNKCINLGPCNLGCPQGAKSSADVTYWPKAIKLGAKLLTNCRVSEIVAPNPHEVTGVKYFTNGEEKFLACKIVVLACNGVGTPRILLNSKSQFAPKGLANSSGLVGKNLMFHPLAYVEGEFPEGLDSNLGPQGCSISSQEFYESDPLRGFVRGYTMQVLRGPSPIEYIIGNIRRKSLRWGKTQIEEFLSKYNKTAHISIICEDLPDPSNFVDLDPTQTDSDGIPAPRINYKLSENSKKMLAHGIRRAEEVMSSAGATKTFSFGPVRATGWHLMGTARMGSDPQNSVVNEWGQSHDISNLFIADSSIFVTSGGVNPAATIQALALKFSDGVIERLRGNMPQVRAVR